MSSGARCGMLSVASVHSEWGKGDSSVSAIYLDGRGARVYGRVLNQHVLSGDARCTTHPRAYKRIFSDMCHVPFKHMGLVSGLHSLRGMPPRKITPPLHVASWYGIAPGEQCSQLL